MVPFALFALLFVWFFACHRLFMFGCFVGFSAVRVRFVLVLLLILVYIAISVRQFLMLLTRSRFDFVSLRPRAAPWCLL